MDYAVAEMATTFDNINNSLLWHGLSCRCHAAGYPNLPVM